MAKGRLPSPGHLVDQITQGTQAQKRRASQSSAVSTPLELSIAQAIIQNASASVCNVGKASANITRILWVADRPPVTALSPRCRRPQRPPPPPPRFRPVSSPQCCSDGPWGHRNLRVSQPSESRHNRRADRMVLITTAFALGAPATKETACRWSRQGRSSLWFRTFTIPAFSAVGDSYGIAHSRA